MRKQTANRQQGFGVIAAVIVLLLLAALAAAILSLSTTQQMTIAQDLASANASLAARAGTDWGMSQALDGPAGYCTAAPLGGTATENNQFAINGMQVAVSCRSTLYNEGLNDDESTRTVRVYQIHAIACSTNPCPGNAANPLYVERHHEVVAAR